MPKYHELFNDVLNVLSDDQLWRRRDLAQAVLEDLDLTDAERSETLGGGGNRAESRVHWSIESLFKSGAITRPTRGVTQISSFGHQLLKDFPDGIKLATLEETEGMKEWYRVSIEGSKLHKGSPGISEMAESATSDTTPDEQIDFGIASLRAAVTSELLSRIRTESPKFLEEIVLKVLHAMGYGEGEDDLEHLGGAGDEGVDGVINQDKLGLDQIYVQAKRYQEGNSIGRPDIQAFVGAISGKSASRGVFITTSRFTKEARDFADRLPQPRIILVDGNQLAELLIEHEIGVTVDKLFKVYKIDENFFEE